MQEAGPSTDRIELVDALRGFALLGIFLANILIFSGWTLMDEAGRAALADENVRHWQHAFHKIFVDGKFYTIFSLLFGAGFALQLERLSRRGADGLRIYRRRAAILVVIGLIHTWLVWDGDILLLYGLMGLILPTFHRWSDRSLLIASSILILVVPPLGAALFALAGADPDLGLRATSDRLAVALGAVDPHDGVKWLRREDFAGWLSWVASGPVFSWGLRVMSWRIPKVLGIMLLGMWVGRRLSDGRLLENRALLWLILVFSLLVGLPASYFYSIGEQDQMSWASLIGTVPLAMAYAAAFALAWPYARNLLGIFRYPGRMALTNYLMQSLICIFVFYGIGLGQVGFWGPEEIYAFAVGVYVVQLLLSRWWLSRHAQGPMEALWRHWTYGRKPMVTQAAASG